MTSRQAQCNASRQASAGPTHYKILMQHIHQKALVKLNSIQRILKGLYNSDEQDRKQNLWKARILLSLIGQRMSKKLKQKNKTDAKNFELLGFGEML